MTTATMDARTLSHRRRHTISRTVRIAPHAARLVPLALALGTAMGGCATEPPKAALYDAATLANFNAGKGELPEGLAIAGDRAYVGFAPGAKIYTVDLATGAAQPFAALPAPVPNQGFMTGIATRGSEVYAALTSFAPAVQAGVYRVGAGGGDARLFARHAEMAFPNGLAFDPAGALYVTDSAAGAVFRASAQGETTKWIASPLLAGAKDHCGPGKGVGVPFDIGANGIVWKDGALYVTNTDKASLLRIAIASDGSPGKVETVVDTRCDDLSGADGLAIDGQGNFIVAANHLDRLVRVTPAGVVSTIADKAALDFPASVAFAGTTLYATNFAFLTAATPNARPALLRLTAR